MKKQLLIAAVAATMGTAAIADISITGNGKYVYTYTDNSEDTQNTNAGSTEINFAIDGKHGDTTVHVEQEYVATNDAGNDNLDVEDMWVATKVGDVSLKFGNWDGSKSANTGEILDNGRSTNKVSMSTSINGIGLAYATSPDARDSDTFVISATLAGQKVSVKEQSDTYTDFNISGNLAGVDYRFDSYDADAANSSATFTTLSYDTGSVVVSAVVADADAGGVFTETDGVFGTEMDLAEGDVKKASAVKVASTLSGNAVSAQFGSRTEVSGEENDFTKIVVSRTLAGGMNAIATYIQTDDVDATTDRDILKAELNVSF